MVGVLLPICRVCKGFRDSDGDREFLFSLPRFPRDEVGVYVNSDMLYHTSMHR